MSERTAVTRRTAVKSIGGALAAGALVGGAGTAAAAGWESVETPVDRDVSDVVYASSGAYAVADAGILLERTGNGWQKVLDGGPTGNGNNLSGAGVTDDGDRVWFVGSSGAIGEYDVTSGSLQDYSAPNDVTNNFNGVAVTGGAGEANVYVAGDSGKIYYSFDNGETFGQVTPGSGSEINAVGFHAPRAGHAVDGNQTVFETDDGSTYDKIGLGDANVTLYGVDSDGADDVWVSGGGGMIFDYDGSGWTPTSVGDAGLRDVEVDGDSGYVVGGGGVVFGYDGDEWTEEQTPTGANLAAVALGSTDVAVGASGVILEK
jgi:streptogramin lyase